MVSSCTCLVGTLMADYRYGMNLQIGNEHCLVLNCEAFQNLAKILLLARCDKTRELLKALVFSNFLLSFHFLQQNNLLPCLMLEEEVQNRPPMIQKISKNTFTDVAQKQRTIPQAMTKHINCKE